MKEVEKGEIINIRGRNWEVIDIERCPTCNELSFFSGYDKENDSYDVFYPKDISSSKDSGG